MTDEVAPGLYVHYRGGLYWVSGVVTHAETHERLVVYQAAAGEFYARPVASFTESAGGVPRFRKATEAGTV